MRYKVPSNPPCPASKRKQTLTCLTHRREMNLEDDEFSIHDPAVRSKKDRPRTSRITGPLEGCPRGGGARSAKKSGPL
ncbi:hypothetical protein BJ165DRAFT_1432747, partial [Panaeolus papilionaceus]